MKDAKKGDKRDDIILTRQIFRGKDRVALRAPMFFEQFLRPQCQAGFVDSFISLQAAL